MLKKVATEKIPAWALCYLMNGDTTGLEDDEIKMVDKFMANYPGATYVLAEEGSSYFTSCPAFGLACDVYDTNVYMNLGKDSTPEKPEKRFYVLDADFIPEDKTNNDLSDEEFKQLAEANGWSLTAEELAAEISEDGNYAPYPTTHFVRYI